MIVGKLLVGVLIFLISSSIPSSTSMVDDLEGSVVQSINKVDTDHTFQANSSNKSIYSGKDYGPLNNATEITYELFQSPNITTKYGSQFHFILRFTPVQLPNFERSVGITMVLDSLGENIRYLDQLQIKVRVLLDNGTDLVGESEYYAIGGPVANTIDKTFYLDVPDASIEYFTIGLGSTFYEKHTSGNDYFISEPYMEILRVKIFEQGENPPPQVTSPPDLEYERGTPYLINWTVLDDIPRSYRFDFLYDDNFKSTYIYEYPDIPINITYDLTTVDLPLKNVTITLEVRDLLGQLSNDTVVVKVVERSTDQIRTNTVGVSYLPTVSIVPIMIRSRRTPQGRQSAGRGSPPSREKKRIRSLQ